MNGPPPTSNGVQFNPYSTPQQQMPTNPMGRMQTMGQSFANVQWRAELSREQRQDLINRIYNELIRATGEAPGPNVWLKAANYELSLFHESLDKQDYFGKISRRIYLLSQRPTMVNPIIQHFQAVQQQQRRLQQSMAMGQAQPMATMGMATPNQFPNFTGTGMQPGQQAQQPQYPGQMTPGGSRPMPQQGMTPGMNTPAQAAQAHAQAQQRAQMMKQQNPEAAKQYWTKHAELRRKYYDNCVYVFQIFRKYVESGRPEDKQTKKLRNLLHYIQQVIVFLGEDYTKNPAKPLSELDKAEAYIKKIVLPYMNRLNSEKGKKGPSSDNSSQQSASTDMTATNAGSNSAPTSTMSMMNQFNAQSASPQPAMSMPNDFFGTSATTSGTSTSTVNSFMPSTVTDSPGADSSSIMDFSMSPFNMGSNDLASQFNMPTGLESSAPGDSSVPLSQTSTSSPSVPSTTAAMTSSSGMNSGGDSKPSESDQSPHYLQLVET